MGAVAGAVEVGVVLVKTCRSAGRLFESLRGSKNGDLACLVVEGKLLQTPAFGRRVFRVSMIVVKPGAVRQNSVGTDLHVPAPLPADVVLRILGIDGQA